MGYNTKQYICGHGACSALIESGLWSEDAVELQFPDAQIYWAFTVFAASILPVE